MTAVGNSSEVANTADTLEIYYAGYEGFKTRRLYKTHHNIKLEVGVEKQ